MLPPMVPTSSYTWESDSGAALKSATDTAFTPEGCGSVPPPPPVTFSMNQAYITSILSLKEPR